MKKIVGGILLVGLLAVSVLAAPHVFLGTYWVRGQLTRGTTAATASLSGRTAILYPSTGDPLSVTTRVQITTEASGAFILNPFYNQLLPLTLEARAFSAAILREHVTGDPGTQQFGAAAVTFGLSREGYNDIALTLAENAGPGRAELSDTGIIRNTRIAISGNDLVINWNYADPTSLPTAVGIYRMTINDAEYSADTTRWSRLTTINRLQSGGDAFTHLNAAHDGRNWYYRVVPVNADDSVVHGNIFISTNNAITVGKVEVPVPANRYVFASLPFMEDNISLAGLVGGQLGADSEFLWWDGISYHGATYAGSRWVGQDRPIRIGEGFIIRARSAGSLALAGRFGTLTIPYVRTLPARPTYNLIAYPYPTSRVLISMGLTPAGSDDLIRWVVDRQVYEGATFSGGWVGPTGIDNFELARPKYYRPSAAQTWTIDFR
ncbi:hypothetical protein HZB07_06795 [Candidatus Saganbacteria bacterium]|nr:hypothetical protein [Candidatus Saganbacteria bacterium]